MEVRYRPVTPDDAKALRKLSLEAFGPLESIFVGMESGGWLAEAVSDSGCLASGTPVGAVILKRFLVKGEAFGLVSWIMSHPKARGLGIAGELRRLGDEWFFEKGITRTFAVIEHYNQSSSKLFASNGYRSLGLAEQIRLFGLRVFPVWFKTMFMVALAHGLWYRDTGETPAESPFRMSRPLLWSGFAKALAFQSFVLLILMARWRAPLGFLEMPAAAVSVSFLIMLFRTLPFQAAARAKGVETRYTAWSGGSLLVAAVAAAGGIIPYSGSLYPRRPVYRYSEVSPALGLGSLMGALGLLCLVAVTRLMDPSEDLPRWVTTGWSMLGSVVPVYFITDVLLPVFPLHGYLGRQIFSWKRWVWVLTALLGAGVMVFA